MEALLEGKESIEKIASDCGMPNSKAYTVAFKEMYGIAPSTYRKMFLKNVKYNEENKNQEMILDEEQQGLLEDLLLNTTTYIYEDECIKINKCKDSIECHVNEYVACNISSNDNKITISLKKNKK